MQGERKQITVLFADIRESTKLIDEMDPEHAAELLDAGIRIMVDAVHRYEGVVNRIQGDGIMALFGAPIAHEDHAVRASRAAITMLREFDQLAHGDIRMGVGLHSGEVLVRFIHNDLSMDYDAAGRTVHLARRMEEVAHADRICISSDTFKLAEGFIEATPLGEVTVKGIGEPVQVYQVTGEAIGRSRWSVRAARGLTSFVNRESELGTLSEARMLVNQGRRQAVAMVGEAGVGKSRLVHEFIENSWPADGARFRSSAVAYGSTPPYALISLLLQVWLSVDHEDSQSDIAGKLDDRLAEFVDDAEFKVPFRALLNLPVDDEDWKAAQPAERHARIVDGVGRWAEQLATDNPILLVFEDLHWADEPSLEIIRVLAEDPTPSKILTLATYRPGSAEVDELIPWTARHRLDPLAPDNASEMLSKLLGDSPELGPLKSLVVQHCEGVPLFIEEITRNLAESGVIKADEAEFKLAHGIDQLPTPASLNATIAARIDRLPAEEKEILQLASVVGTRFSLPILDEIAGVPSEDVRASVKALVESEFIQPAQRSPRTGFRFKHVLIQEVAYESCLLERRRQLHAEVVQAIQSVHGDRLDEHIDALAHHAFSSRLWDQAAQYNSRAGDAALECSAYGQAISLFDRAITALDQLPSTTENTRHRIDLQLNLRAAHNAIGGTAEALDALQNAEDLSSRIEDHARLAVINIFKSTEFSHQGNLGAAITSGDRACAAAVHSGDAGLIANARFALALAHYHNGGFRTVVETLQPSLADLRGPLREARFGTTGMISILSFGILTGSHACLGNFEQAHGVAREALKIADTAARPFDLGMALYFDGLTDLLQGRLLRAGQSLDRGLAICEESGLRFLVPWLMSEYGLAQALGGNSAGAQPLLETALEQSKQMGIRHCQARTTVYLGRAALGVGRFDEALGYGHSALTLSRDYQLRAVEAWSHLVIASALLRNEDGQGEDAERHIRDALALADELDMRVDQAHARALLALVHAKGGRHADAQVEAALAVQLYDELGVAEELRQTGQDSRNKRTH